MNEVTSFPHPVREIPHVWIPMPDGVRLAARVWMPEDAEHRPVPAVLEYIPYRHRDFTAWRDSITHPYLAGHGYACVRVDLRGSGASEGVLTDEYLPRELEDGVEVLRWIGAQDWCDGKVGMIGISWGGFNGLQIAALQPPELQAVVSVCSTDDRYADDVHYMGGCLLGDNLSWSSVMFAYNSLPPDPAVVGPAWRDMWMERLEKSGLWLDTWLRHQRRDAYWKHGSICEDVSAVRTPVMAVSGWADGYSNAVLRLLANLEAPCKGLIGPWSHRYPHLGKPGPAIGFLQEVLRWYDHWLKGVDTGVMDEPALRAWMQASCPPHAAYSERPGRWVAEPSWPSANVEVRTHPLAPLRIEAPGTPVEEKALPIQSPLAVGLFAGKWCSYSATPDLPHDQRQEDGGALVFDSEFLEQDLEILGQPVAELELTSDKPVAMVAVRLSDVAPDDKATRVTYGVLNLNHSEDFERVENLEPGRRYRVKVPLNDVGQHFPAGHRLRLAISTSYWPLVWPSPEPVRLTIFTDNSFLHLPVRPPREEDAQLRPFPEPEGAPPITRTLLEPKNHNWWVKRDLANDISTLEVVKDEGLVRNEDSGIEVRDDTREWYTFVGDDFETPRGEVRSRRGLGRDDWQIETRTRTVLTCNRTHFVLRAELDAYEGDRRVFSKTWDSRIERDGL